ncbi:hydroxyethylthiazole kinase [Naematelia encephala]|uniref:hydroxyethylthiazole kinase n=1 Tax=Naematelia encephala TaxID=71784 RepID=A0A1Y2B6T0_9TREE|nr:hydroxyethylthiazole kinase [Naematelia encephala]
MPPYTADTADNVLEHVTSLYDSVRTVRPLVLHLTNIVVVNDQANITLALGGSPIMSLAAEEQELLSPMVSALLLNIGTIHRAQRETMLIAAKQAGRHGKPIILDPVGVALGGYRAEVVQDILDNSIPAVITGNAAEIGYLARLDASAKGVDSIADLKDPVRVVRDLAKQTGSVIVLHGEIDYVSDGETVVQLSNGHVDLSKVTGTGCSTGSAIATFVGVALDGIDLNPRGLEKSAADERNIRRRIFAGSVAGVLATSLAGELAVEASANHGTASFKAAWIGSIGRLTGEIIKSRAKVVIRYDQ